MGRLQQRVPVPHPWQSRHQLVPLGTISGVPEPTYIRLKTRDGHSDLFPRIRFGQESDFADLGIDSCHDCGAQQGTLHATLCDMEVCPACGGQLLSCDCEHVGED